MAEYLFVYGSLRDGFTPPEVKPLLVGIKRLSPATVAGKLYDLGEYSGAVLDQSSGRITGELLELRDPHEQLTALDRYEGCDVEEASQCLFIRTKCQASLPDGQAVNAWIYVYNQSLAAARLIESGDYAEVAQP